MADLDYYVNTDSTSGGDGTTNNTTGTTRAFASASEAEASLQQNLVSAGDTLTINCFGSTAADTAQLVMLAADWTTGASNWVKWLGDFNSDRYDTTAYRISYSDTYDGMAETEVGYLTLERMQFYNTGAITNYSNNMRLYFTSAYNNSTFNIEKCLFRQPTTTTTGYHPQIYEAASATGMTWTIRDTLVYDGHSAIGIDYPPSNTTVQFINNTLQGAYNSGYYIRYCDTVILHNNIVTDIPNGDCYDTIGTTTLSTSNNISDDATSPDGASWQNKTITYTDAANDVFTTSDSDVTNQGVGPSSQALVSTLSLEGNTRSGTTTDVGAFQLSTSIVLNALTSGSYGYLTSVTTNSISPTSNALVLLFINMGGGDSDPTSLSGGGMTSWTKIGHISYNSSNYRTVAYRALEASPSSGAITWNQTEMQGAYSVFEFTGVDTSGSNGSGAVVQSVSAQGETGNTPPHDMSVTLASFSDVNNATVGGVGCASGYNNAVGSGFSVIHNDTFLVSRNIVTEYKLTNDTTVEISNTDTTYLAYGIIALEIKNATAAPTVAGILQSFNQTNKFRHMIGR